MDGVAHRIVVRAQVIFPNRAHHHFAGMNAYPDAQRQARCLWHPSIMTVYRILHPERGVERPQGVVLMRDGRTEQRQDAIAKRFCDVSLIVVNRLHHHGHDGVDQSARILGIQVLDQGRRASDIREQSGNGLAFARRLPPGFHRRLFGQDALGQMCRRIEHRCRPKVLTGGNVGQQHAAIAAESRRSARLMATLRADSRKALPARLAESPACRVIESALDAQHMPSDRFVRQQSLETTGTVPRKLLEIGPPAQGRMEANRAGGKKNVRAARTAASG
ncbi:hypothetical protein CBM2589_B130014 [Cupriavidus taiwanensis]|uniref:Uncharacterized protein n=1 Tax=Cupriavidus taiwanensis TaxID=164546 RepID=A0A375BI80_9BURK|nr:hypothetical protein CBM2589_B130014 [Cupriavidus taiwanensis]